MTNWRGSASIEAACASNICAIPARVPHRAGDLAATFGRRTKTARPFSGRPRFDKTENDRARHFFEMAIRLDPTFSRDYAGLSFTHYWQNAFQGWAERKPEVERAYAAAGQSLMADDRDPAASWAVGRALWLRGLQEQSLAHLNQAVDLSPNFAQAHYALAFVHSTAGFPVLAASSADHSRRLSPFDPMLFAIFAVRAMALARLGRFDEAADWAVNGAARPNAHTHIQAVAA